ncbi:MAG: ArnT family glycosyltransferase [Anaerolineae bacterium]
MEDRLSPIERGLLMLVLAISLALRLSGLSVFTTSDEDRWFYRSVAFRTALQEHDWASTYQSGHPGVVTMWLGAAAQQFPLLQRSLPIDGASPYVHGEEPAMGAGVPPISLGARRLVALVSWLGIVALFFLLRRLLGQRVALLGTVFVALDPFYLAHSRLHHLDALLTTFSMLSIACLLVYELRGRRIGFLLASAAAAALAIANKSPGVLLMPWAGLALLLPRLLGERSQRRQELLRGLGVLALWALALGVVFVAIWPALWVNPIGTLRTVFGTATYYAETPHESNNYFWFAVRADPGPAFYPVAWAFRATPWAVLGLVALVVAWKREMQQRLGLVLLAVGGLVFTAAMTLGAKKFDRYLLPVYPLMDVLAAVGWVALLKWALPRLGPRWQRLAPTFALGLLVAGQLLWLIPAYPYYLSYYNPLLGGAKTAPSILLTGWGEGLDRVADYMNRKPDARELVICSWPTPEFGYFFVGRSIKDTKMVSLAELDYCIFYRSSLQRERAQPASLFFGARQPEMVLHLNGIDYAWVFENTVYDEAEQEILADIEATADPAQDLILVDVKATLARNYHGAVPLEVFIPVDRLDALQTGLQNITAGRRHIWHLVYPDETDGITGKVAEQLSQQATVGREIQVDGVRAIRYDLPAEPHFVPAVPTIASGVRFGDELTLVGYDIPRTQLTPGQPFLIRLHWQVERTITRSYITFIHLIGPGEAKYGQMDAMPHAWTFPTDTWQAGDRVVDDCTVEFSADAPVGGYVAVLGLYDRETRKRLRVYDAAGNRLANDVLVLGGLAVPASANP